MQSQDAEAQQPLLSEKHPVEPPRRTRPHRRWAFLATGAVLLATAICMHQYRGTHGDQLRQCPSPDAAHVKAPRTNLWKNLDVAEATALRQWLADPARGLNLTDSAVAMDSDNFIHLVENYPPPKDDALAYLSDATRGVARYARAIVNEGVHERISDYLIGPLPLSNATKLRPITEIYHAPIPLNARTTFNYAILAEAIGRLVSPLDDILHDLFNISTADRTLTLSAVMPLSYDGSWRRAWAQLKRERPGHWLHAVDFHFLVDLTGTDGGQYSIMAYIVQGKMYRTAAELRAAYDAGQMQRKADDWDLTDWATRAIRGKRRDLDDRAGPRSIQADGARYRLDVGEGYVTWMGWAFYTSFQRDMGLHLWDIRFRSERIIYELSPQEAMAQYSGGDPHQAATVWLDRAFGMGGMVREVILGYDCPSHATLLNATVHEMGSTTRRNAICLYEREAERPLSRHTGKGKDEMGAVKGYELVVRSVSSVGNYDYIFDYVFQLDGTIEVRVSASGYLQGGYWEDEQAPYGHKLRAGAMGSLHDHVINYKIDFDVLGTKNSFMKVGLERETLDVPWADIDGWGAPTQSKIVREIVEEEGVFNYPQNMEGAYVVINEEEKNAWGNPRGYALHPGPLCHLANLDAKRTEKSVQWAKHHLGVTRYHDNEPSSCSMWNGNLPGAPPVDYDKLFNNESIRNKDLVVWANLGTHHIPRAEDSPNTLTNVATSYFLLIPWNFHDEDPAIDSRNSVLLNNEDGNWHIVEPVRQPRCAVSQPHELTYHGLEGWREDGTPMTPIEISEMRTHNDMIHRFGM